jgi:hypothetical protein
MKINDIIYEAYTGFKGHLKDFGSVKRGRPDEAIPGAVIEPEIRNTDTYMQMRYGMALAAAAAQRDGTDDGFEQESVWAENIGMVGYSDAELDQIKAADKLMGVKSVEVTARGSQERTDVNKTSPVANTSWRKTK